MYEPNDHNTYEPEVNDYVVWERPNGDIDEGWVYFKGDPVDNEKRIKDGWNPVSQYITIETSVKPKTECVYTSGKPMKHKMIHTLLLCNRENWHELKFIKRRSQQECQHYSQYDDVHGNEDSASMYKSQRHRYQDIQ
tara:strand:- start:2100 stop:2510 length:411 start_codon:yes stop_codon:yes gene_type:complete